MTTTFPTKIVYDRFVLATEDRVQFVTDPDLVAVVSDADNLTPFALCARRFHTAQEARRWLALQAGTYPVALTAVPLRLTIEV